MHNIPVHNKLYNSLLSSIDQVEQVQHTIKKDKSLLSAYSDFLHNNEAELSKFRQITSDLQKWLDEYDFNNGFDFNAMQKKLEKIHPLRLKLVKMGEEAKNLSAYPDRYNSKKSIEICRMLTIICQERLRIEEMEKILQLVDTNTSKLIYLQKLLKRDADILKQINAEIDSTRAILTNLKAYFAELMCFVSDFPHAGQDDLSIVKNRINCAKELLNLQNDVDKQIAAIKGYCDRYNKNNVVSKYTNIVRTIASTMKYSDVGAITRQLKDIPSQIDAVLKAFAKEHSELKSLKAELHSINHIWRDDKEDIIATIDNLLNTDHKKCMFNIDELKNRFHNAIQRRDTDIQNMEKQYPWLTNSNKYNSIHRQLLSKYIGSAEYFATLNRLKTYRTTRIILTCIPVIGWFLLLFMKDFTL